MTTEDNNAESMDQATRDKIRAIGERLAVEDIRALDALDERDQEPLVIDVQLRVERRHVSWGNVAGYLNITTGVLHVDSLAKEADLRRMCADVMGTVVHIAGEVLEPSTLRTLGHDCIWKYSGSGVEGPTFGATCWRRSQRVGRCHPWVVHWSLGRFT